MPINIINIMACNRKCNRDDSDNNSSSGSNSSYYSRDESSSKQESTTRGKCCYRKKKCHQSNNDDPLITEARRLLRKIKHDKEDQQKFREGRSNKKMKKKIEGRCHWSSNRWFGK